MAIALPIFSKYQAQIASAQVKTDLQQAAILVEQKLVDNNGLYPKYVPNEIKANASMKDFIYTYSVDRTKYCLQATSAEGKLFISSESKSVSTNICTQPMVGVGSSTPFQTPSVGTTTITSASNTWSANGPASVATVSWNAIVCPLASQDQAEWGSKATITYSLLASNSTRSTPTLAATPWDAGTSATLPLTGWLPGDHITYKVQARCTISSGTQYQYSGDYSAPIADVVDTFKVTPITFTSGPSLNWSPGATGADYNLQWTAGSCPVGTLQYKVDAKDNSGVTDSTNYVTWASGVARTLPATFVGGNNITLSHYVSCLLSNGARIDSAATTASGITPLQPPSTPASITANNAQGATTVIPNNVVWPSVTCAVGTPQYNVARTAPDSASSGWITSLNQNLSLTAGTTYTYQVQARCVSGTQTSTPSAYTAPITFLAEYTIPTAPSTVTGLRSDAAGTSSITDNRLLWNAATCSGSAYPEYSIQQTVKNGSNVSTTPTAWMQGQTYNIQSGWLAYGSTLGFQIQARCTNSTGSSTVTAWSSTYSMTTLVPAPAVPTSVSNNGDNTVSWGAVTCSTGTTAQYRLYMTTLNNNTGNWYQNYSTARSDTVDNMYHGYPQTGEAQAYCAGPNANSPTVTSGATSWTSTMNGQVPSMVFTCLGSGDSNNSCWRAVSYSASNCSTGSSVHPGTLSGNTAGFGGYSTTGYRYSNTGTGWGSFTAKADASCQTSYANGPSQTITASVG